MILTYGNDLVGYGGDLVDYAESQLPPRTIRVRYTDGVTPQFSTMTQVSVSPNVWDITNMNSDWYAMFDSDPDLIEVIASNTRGVTGMQNTFWNCSGLVSVSGLDTSTVVVLNGTFAGCTSLKAVPLLDTGVATNVNSLFQGCLNVESGALAMYNRMSTQATPPLYHSMTFLNCGSWTPTGRAELEQIPEDWRTA